MTTKPFKVLVLSFMALLLFNCEEDTFIEDENSIEEIPLIIDNPIALDIQSRSQALVRPFKTKTVSDQITFSANGAVEEEEKWVTFEQEYGLIDYPDMIVTDSVNTATLFPLLNEQRQLVGWLKGFYNENGNIEYRVNKVESDIQLGEDERIYYYFPDDKLYYFNATSQEAENVTTGIEGATNTSISGSTLVCGDVYESVCISVGTGDFSNEDQFGTGEEGDFTCYLDYKGYQCWYADSEEIENADGTDGGGPTGDGEWEDPFEGAEGTGSGDNDNSGEEEGSTCPPGTEPDGAGNCIKTCDGGYINDGNNNCVLDPCADINSKNTNTEYTSRINMLKEKVGDKQETGYGENTDGGYDVLDETVNDGHSLKFPHKNNRLGFMHTHINNFIKGTDVIKPIRMFSPADLKEFLNLVRLAHFNNRDISKVYGTMVTKEGVYTLKFLGDNIQDLSIAFDPDDDKELFKRYFKEYDSLEEAFLRYMQNETNNHHVALYRQEADGTLVRRKLDALGNHMQSDPCN